MPRRKPGELTWGDKLADLVANGDVVGPDGTVRAISHDEAAAALGMTKTHVANTWHRIRHHPKRAAQNV